LCTEHLYSSQTLHYLIQRDALVGKEAVKCRLCCGRLCLKRKADLTALISSDQATLAAGFCLVLL